MSEKIEINGNKIKIKLGEFIYVFYKAIESLAARIATQKGDRE